MGLFSKNKNEEKTKLTEYKPTLEQEAWIGVIYACANADKNVSDFEIEQLSRILTFKSIFREYNKIELYKKVSEAALNMTNEKLIDVCVPLISDEWRATVFALAVELVVGDGNLEAFEEKIIEYLQKKLDISDELAQKIVDVILIKQKGSIEITDEDIENY